MLLLQNNNTFDLKIKLSIWWLKQIISTLVWIKSEPIKYLEYQEIHNQTILKLM